MTPILSLVWTKNTLKTEIFENDEVTMISRDFPAQFFLNTNPK